MRARTGCSRIACARFLCALVAAAALAGGSGRALADVREDARREFTAGQAADKRGDWQKAIEHYLRANDLVPHPFAIYNVALNYERLDKLREAATWFERYLATATDSAEREKVQRTLRELKLRPARFTVRSVPDRARVYVDTVPVGATPYEGTLRGGLHRISIELDGRRDQRDVTVEYAELVSLEFVLRDAVGTLYVTGAPYGAEFTVDGAPAGKLPARIPVAAGTHTVRVPRGSAPPFEATVEVVANRETAVDARMTAGPGGLGALGSPRVIRAGYLLGGGGGIDARSGSALGLVELGVRVNQFDLSTRVGRAAGFTHLDLGFRWSFLPGRLSPFAGAGYVFVKGGGGYTLAGGVRYDVTRADRGGLSVMVESGLRFSRGVPEDPEPGEPTVEESGFAVPVMASLVVVYK